MYNQDNYLNNFMPVRVCGKSITARGDTIQFRVDGTIIHFRTFIELIMSREELIQVLMSDDTTCAIRLPDGEVLTYIEGDWAGDPMLFDTKKDAFEYLAELMMAGDVIGEDEI